MRTKKTLKQKKHLGRPRNRRIQSGVVCLMVIFGMAAVAGSWRSPLRYIGNPPLFSPPAPLPPATSPSKEYIYAGGRLIATEEPNPVALAAPTSLVANTISDVRIDISWVGTPNAHHYQIQRATNLGGTFTILNSNVIGTTFADTSVTAVNAYLYQVMAADASGNLSPASNVDLATAIAFVDNPLSASVVVKAQHVLQLRQAVNAARLAVNLSPAVWSQATLTQQTTAIKAIDIQELRTALDQALSPLGLPTGGYTTPSLSGQPIQKIHIEELRNRVK
jgi:hypothetical protein